jgi:hypothetical protein
MRLRHFRLVPLCALALAAGPAAAFVPHAENHGLEFPLLYDAVPQAYPTARAADLEFARSSSLEPSWTIQANPRTGTVHAAYGGGVQLAASVTSEAQAETLARDFLLGRTDVLGVRSDNMQLRSVRHWNGKYAVHYRQVLFGLPVHTATAWVLMHADGRVAGFGSDFIPDTGDIPAHATLSEAQAVQTAAAALGTTPRTDAPVEVSQLYVPAPAGELLELTIAYRVVFESEEPFGKWESTVNGITGEILARRNLYFPINVTGTVNGDVQNQLPTLSYCDGPGTEPLSNLTVSVSGGNSDATDAGGAFDINHGGASAVNVTATLSGPYINVNRVSGIGSDASITQSVTPGTPAVFSFTTGNARRDEMDTFFHGNRIRDFMIGLDPTFTNLDVPVISNVGNAPGVGFCPGNAWWNIGGANMNFCIADPTYGNTGEMGNVIYHEYGHGVTEMVYSRNGQAQPVGDLHEGNSDIVANFLDRNPHIGLGFFVGNCTSGIRNASNTLQWPADNNGGHFGGQIIAGFHWDAWQSMLGSMPQALADSIAFHTWHYARDMGTPTDQAAQVLWTFMMDDDDADVTNGTPNHDHFCLAATNHGFSCTEILAVGITHTPLPTTTDDSIGYTVVAQCTSSVAAIDPAEVKLTYSVDGGADTELLMTATGNPDEYSATIPAQDQHSEIEYFISAMDVATNRNAEPFLTELTGKRFAFDVVMIHETMEAGIGGWTTSVSGATTGFWELVDPIGTSAQPEDDATPSPGVSAWITGQCSGPNCSGGCTLGCNDVDVGTVTLTSPVYDVSAFDQVTVKYDRWYSNNTGADPNNDFWVVEISNDGGSTWTTVENTSVSAPSWTSIGFDVDAVFGTPGQVQVRLLASDLNAGSLVEAGVDEFRILAAVSGPVTSLETVPAPAVLSLEQNQPNPFSPQTSIRFALPQRADVRLAVYDVQGRAVRQLAAGTHAAGRYDVTWNGRDAQGDRVAAGVYFYRLTAGEETLTRKMTVLK